MSALLPKRSRTLRRFILELGACSVPAFVKRGRSPAQCWQYAGVYGRRWIRNKVFRRIYELQWDFDFDAARQPGAAQKRMVFAAFEEFRRTGLLQKPVAKQRGAK